MKLLFQWRLEGATGEQPVSPGAGFKVMTQLFNPRSSAQATGVRGSPKLGGHRGWSWVPLCTWLGRRGDHAEKSCLEGCHGHLGL